MPCAIRISNLFPSGDLQFQCVWIAENPASSQFDLEFVFLPFFQVADISLFSGTDFLASLWLKVF